MVKWEISVVKIEETYNCCTDFKECEYVKRASMHQNKKQLIRATKQKVMILVVLRQSSIRDFPKADELGCFKGIDLTVKQWNSL